MHFGLLNSTPNNSTNQIIQHNYLVPLSVYLSHLHRITRYFGDISIQTRAVEDSATPRHIVVGGMTKINKLHFLCIEQLS